jgi:hypothetical protein
MKLKALFGLVVFFATVLFSYSSANAQIVDKTVEKTKDVASATKKATVGTAKKTSVVVTDAFKESADKTKEVTSDVAGTAKTKTQAFGKTTVNVTENVAGQTYEGGKWFTVTTWDGAKWVSKREWFPNKKKQ